MDQLSQERLVVALKEAIDAVRDRPLFLFSPTNNGMRGALVRLAQLVRDNPRSIRSSHVRYNLGTARAAWLDDFCHVVAAHESEEAIFVGQDEEGTRTAAETEPSEGTVATAQRAAARGTQIRSRHRRT